MRAFLLVACSVLLLGCSKSEKAPSGRGPEATPEQVQALHAGNERLAAKVKQYIQETKKTPANLDEVRTWAGAAWDAADDKASVDPWGNKIFLNVQLASTGSAFTLRSMGADGETSDDDFKYDSRDRTTRTEAQRNPK